MRDEKSRNNKEKEEKKKKKKKKKNPLYVDFGAFLISHKIRSIWNFSVRFFATYSLEAGELVRRENKKLNGIPSAV